MPEVGFTRPLKSMISLVLDPDPGVRTRASAHEPTWRHHRRAPSVAGWPRHTADSAPIETKQEDDDVVGIGIIGTGKQGTDHARRIGSLGDKARLVAVHDLDGGLAEAVATECGARVAGDDQALIEDPEVDAVIVASNTETHVKYVLACIAAGKPVMTEKPLGITVPSCELVLEAEMEADRRFTTVGFMRRYDPEYGRLKRTLDDDAIGTPLVMHCIHRNPSVPRTFATRQTLTDTVIHEIDIARWLLDDEIVSVALEKPRHEPSVTHQLADPLLVRLAARSGARVDIEVFSNAGYGYDVRCEVLGTKGYVAMGPRGHDLVTAETAPEQGFPSDWLERFRPAYDAEISDWVDSLDDGRLTANAWDGFAATVVAEALVRALQTGHREAVSVGPQPDLYR
jgi:myo-inositol 2-dehydrogenase/D-chiro-inositol 1-dehydrogenase